MPESDERYTPWEVIHVRDQVWPWGTDTDPCWHPKSRSWARVTYTKEQDGTKRPWFGRVWMNCPWSETARWIALLVAHCERSGRNEGMALVRNDPSTRWWRVAWEAASAIAFLSERTRYYEPDEGGGVVLGGVPTFSSVVFFFGDDPTDFVRWLSDAGHYAVKITDSRRRMEFEHLQDNINKAIQGEIIKLWKAHPEETVVSFRSRMIDAVATWLEHPVSSQFDELSFGALSRASDADDDAPMGVRHHERKAAPDRVVDGAEGAADQANPKVKPKAKPKAKRKAPPKAEAAANGAPQSNLPKLDPSAGDQRAAKIVEWIRSEGFEVFKASTVMNHFGISRQTATRALQMIPIVNKVGEGAGTRYVVSKP